MLSGLFCGERGKRWSVLLVAREKAKRKNVLSHVDWSVLLLAMGGSEERARMVSTAFYVARRRDPGRLVSVILIGRNI